MNYQELSRLMDVLRPEIEGLYLERIIVPERPRFPSQYLKGEWVLRLTGRRQETHLLISVRPRHPGLVYLGDSGPRAAPQATRSPFDLALTKHLRGAKLLSAESLPRERTVILWFSGDSSSPYPRLGLVLTLIPAAPEALLIGAPEGDTRPESFPILARSRQVGDAPQGSFTPPDGHQAPANPPVREDLIRTPQAHGQAIAQALEAEAFAARLTQATRALKEVLSHAQERVRQNETAIREAQAEADWQRFGDLLKSSMGQQPPLEQKPGKGKERIHFRRLQDYLASEPDGAENWIEVPCDPKLSLPAQVEKFYQLARRKQRRLQEAQYRLKDFREMAAQAAQSLAHPPATGDWPALERLEKEARIEPSQPAATGREAKKKGPRWLGKSFTSRDGWSIWVGRSKDENLELTFKHARGNDVWLHVRGKPGAHTVIPIQPGKSVPLETLLDAAALTVYYSGGEKWGKTEVDYTFKKHVKRIKDSTEASYTHNKTLLVQPDPARLKRLLGGNSP